MAHIISVMSTINGQLNTISNWYYNGKRNSLRDLPNIPNFVYVSTDRSVDFHKENKIDSERDVDIYKAILCDTGDNYNPVYLCITTNIENVMIDTVPVYINKNSDTGPGVAYIVNIPEDIFSQDCNFDYCAEVLINLYFELLSYDPNMKYRPEAAIIKYSKDDRLKVPTYDLEMIITAIGYANINLYGWFNGSIEDSINAFFNTSQFRDTEISEDIKKGIIETLKRHASNKISSLKDSIANGELIMDALYEVDE